MAPAWRITDRLPSFRPTQWPSTPKPRHIMSTPGRGHPQSLLTPPPDGQSASAMRVSPRMVAPLGLVFREGLATRAFGPGWTNDWPFGPRENRFP